MIGIIRQGRIGTLGRGVDSASPARHTRQRPVMGGEAAPRQVSGSSMCGNSCAYRPGLRVHRIRPWQ